MHNLVYQILHPWHWLTYGQNAAGLALVGLFFYTLYTRRMMKLSESARRANLIPVFSLRGLPEYEPTDVEQTPASELGLAPPIVKEFSVVLNIRNLGEGPAILLQSWHQPVSERFSVDNTFLLVKSKGAADGEQAQRDLIKGESTKVNFRGFRHGENRPWLFVVQSTDMANGKHQLKILMTSLSRGRG